MSGVTAVHAVNIVDESITGKKLAERWCPRKGTVMQHLYRSKKVGPKRHKKQTTPPSPF